MDNGDQILRSYSILSALKQNIPDKYEVAEDWVREYHLAIDKLERALDIDLGDFKVPQEHLQRSIASSNYRTGAVSYRDGLWCQRTVLMHKLDSALTYFSGLQSGTDKTIGFEPS